MEENQYSGRGSHIRLLSPRQRSVLEQRFGIHYSLNLFFANIVSFLIFTAVTFSLIAQSFGPFSSLVGLASNSKTVVNPNKYTFLLAIAVIFVEAFVVFYAFFNCGGRIVQQHLGYSYPAHNIILTAWILCFSANAVNGALAFFLFLVILPLMGYMLIIVGGSEWHWSAPSFIRMWLGLKMGMLCWILVFALGVNVENIHSDSAMFQFHKLAQSQVFAVMTQVVLFIFGLLWLLLRKEIPLILAIDVYYAGLSVQFLQHLDTGYYQQDIRIPLTTCLFCFMFSLVAVLREGLLKKVCGVASLRNRAPTPHHRYVYHTLLDPEGLSVVSAGDGTGRESSSANEADGNADENNPTLPQSNRG